MLVCLECVWVEVDLEPREISKIRSPLWFEGAEVLAKVEQCQAKWDHGIMAEGVRAQLLNLREIFNKVTKPRKC